MSGALIELVATGVQDAYLTGQPEVSFFRQKYMRHTNFAMKPVQLNPVGQLAANSEVSITIPNKGDLLSHVWLDLDTTDDTINVGTALGSNVVTDAVVFELWIGGQMVDRQDSFFMNQIYNKFLADTASKARNNTVQMSWLPLTFWFCGEGQHIPLVALQYQEVEIRVKFNSQSPANYKFYAEYVLLDTTEREILAKDGQELLITQVQKIQSQQPGGNKTNKFDLSLLNHPVKGLFFSNVLASATPADTTNFNEGQLYLNGTEVFASRMDDKYFREIQPYYHCDYTTSDTNKGGDSNLKMYSFAQKVNRFQPTGTCNFSRLDNADLAFSNVHQGPSSGFIDLYAVNYNVLRFKGGMAGVAFGN